LLVALSFWVLPLEAAGAGAALSVGAVVMGPVPVCFTAMVVGTEDSAGAVISHQLIKLANILKVRLTTAC
jgi:hypothetical protein